MLSRREFLSRSALISLAPTVPGFLARAARAAAPDREGRVLVVVQLDGGNDGINTVVPFADENYARHRKQLRLPIDRLIKLNDRVALNSALADAAKLLGYAARVYYTIQSGYDTHAAQLGTHANLLREFAGALKAFLDDLAGARLADRVVVLAFSEFGRQLQENASAGTDHGVAGPVFLAGSRVHAGVAGTAPSLTDLDAGAPKMTVDFRRVYAAILEDWLGIAAKACLGGEFTPLPLFRNA